MHVMVEEATKNLSGVSASLVEMNSGIQFYDGITTDEIQQILVKSAANLITLDTPNYQLLQHVCSCLVFVSRSMARGMSTHTLAHIKNCVELGVYDRAILDKYTEEEIAQIGSWIDHDRDLLFTYAGLRQVVDKYLVQDRSSGEVYETPQFMYMLIAATIFQDYPTMSRPIMSNDTTTQSASTNSTFPHLSWECELHFDNLRNMFLLMLMTPSIASLAVTWGHW